VQGKTTKLIFCILDETLSFSNSLLKMMRQISQTDQYVRE